MKWILTLSVLSVIWLVELRNCANKIVLEPYPNHTVYANWINVSTLLRCPVHEYDWAVWYSRERVYKQIIGCVTEEANSLALEYFPDTPYIIAEFVSRKLLMKQKCLFSSERGVLSGVIYGETPEIMHLQKAKNAIYYRPAVPLDINFVICNTGEVRNGTCLVHIKNGSIGKDKMSVRMDNQYYKVTGRVIPEHIENYECFVNLSRTFYQFLVQPKAEVDECTRASILGYNLCSSSECIDLDPGYTCSATDFINLNLCKTNEDWFCPHRATYEYMKSDHCAIDACIQAANEKISLCDEGVYDCVTTEQSYTCRTGIPLLDVCDKHREALNLSCPELPKNTRGLAVYGRSLKALTYNAKALYLLDPQILLDAIGQMTDQVLQKEIEKHNEQERAQLVTELLETVAVTLNGKQKNDRRVVDDRNVTTVNETVVPSDLVKPNEKVKSVAALLHVVAAVTRQTPSVRQMIDDGVADRGGVKLMRIVPGSASVYANVTAGTTIALIVEKNTTHQSDPEEIVAMVPEEYVNRHYESKPATDYTEEELQKRPVIIDSDVVLIDTAVPHSKYQLTMELPQQPKNNLQCRQLRHSMSEPEQDWSSSNCETVIVGLRYECHCTSDQTGTFAIALVYWIGTTDIPTEISPLINLLNYIFIVITIIALFLFLFFSLFVGVFRLDQFNIALCLLLSAIFPLAVPQVDERQLIGCAIVAIAVCYFPLAAFSWKFIFGLNTLLLIVSPQSRYHEWISNRKHSVPLLLIGYMIPALIIGIWFGSAGSVSYSGHCIGPAKYRWVFVGAITVVVLFNLIVLAVVGAILLRSYLVTRRTRVTKSTHLLVLTQLMLTLGIPYVVIYLQFVNFDMMMIAVPIALALTSVLMFLLIAVIDKENRDRLSAFLRHYLLRSFISSKTNGSVMKENKFASKHPLVGRRNTTKTTDRGWTVDDNNKIGGCEPMLLDCKDQDVQTSAQRTNPHVTFEPGWLHRVPAYNYKPGNVVWDTDGKRTSSSDEFNGIVMRDAPIARMDTMRSTLNSEFNPSATSDNPNDAPTMKSQNGMQQTHL